MFGKPLRSYFQTSSLAVLHYIRASSDAFNVELIITFSENIKMWKVLGTGLRHVLIRLKEMLKIFLKIGVRCSNFDARKIGQKELILSFKRNYIKLTEWESIPCDAQESENYRDRDNTLAGATL